MQSGNLVCLEHVSGALEDNGHELQRAQTHDGAVGWLAAAGRLYARLARVRRQLQYGIPRALRAWTPHGVKQVAATARGL